LSTVQRAVVFNELAILMDQFGYYTPYEHHEHEEDCDCDHHH